MSNRETDLLEAFDSALDLVSPVVRRAIETTDLTTPAGEDGEDLGSVLNHLTYLLLYATKVASGGTPPDVDHHHLGDDPYDAFHDAAMSARREFVRPGLIETPCPEPWEHLTGADVVRDAITSLLTEGRRVATASGQSSHRIEELAGTLSSRR